MSVFENAMRDVGRRDGPICDIMCELESELRLRVPSQLEIKRLTAAFHELVPSRKDAFALLKRMGQMSWPGSYGQSPWDSTYAALREVFWGSRGFPCGQAMRGAGFCMAQTYFWWFYAPATDETSLERGYPRLLSRLRRFGLTHTESFALIRAMRARNLAGRERLSSSEATNHCGGDLKVLREVFARRHWI